MMLFKGAPDFQKRGELVMVILGLIGVFVLFSAMPAMGQTGEIVRSGWSTNPSLVPTFLLLTCMGAQVLIAASLGIYLLRRGLKSGSLRPPGIFLKAFHMGKNGPRSPISPSPVRRAA